MNDSKRSRILVVDDERANIIALTQILKPEYSTLAVIDGQAALDVAKNAMPDLILLDIIMPVMSGFEVLTELKHNEYTKKIPVIFITGLDNAEDEEKGFDYGAVDYITKPFHNSIVRARVKTHIQMAKYIREIEHFGLTDTLTNLPNRRNFDSRIEIEWGRAIREHEPLSIILIDIDMFKLYNDTYGHKQGDALLSELAENFTKTLKRNNDFVARWGGEEFIVLLPNTDMAGALEISEQIRLSVEKMIVFCLDGTPTSATISIGVNTELPGADSSISDFINRADKALYTAKNSGRNRVCAAKPL